MSVNFFWRNTGRKQAHLRQTNLVANPDAMGGVIRRSSQESHRNHWFFGQEGTEYWTNLSQVVKKAMREEFQQFQLEKL